MDRLANKIAYVTGSAGGIGAASVRRFAQEGATVIMADINGEANEQLSSELKSQGFNVTTVRVDSRDEADVKKSFDKAVSSRGRLDILFNCAGGSTSNDGPVDKISNDFLEETLRLEVVTVASCSRAALPYLRAAGGGCIINMSSFVAFRSAVEIHAYIAGKGAIKSLTSAMARSYAKDNIRVNAIAPGVALSERARRRIDEINSKSDLTFSWSDYPFATGSPIDIANVAVFLASDESRMINGQTIRADGGLSVY